MPGASSLAIFEAEAELGYGYGSPMATPLQSLARVLMRVLLLLALLCVTFFS